MVSISVQLLLLTTVYTHAVKPPGYVEPDKPEDPHPPKYAYKYSIADNKDEAEHGKEERRDGIHAEGRYYVQDKQRNQDVRYFADDWGYHSAVEYSNVGPHSKSKTKFALGTEAVQLLKNKENNLPQLQGLPNIGRLADTTTNLGVQPPKFVTTTSPPQLQSTPELVPIPSTPDPKLGSQAPELVQHNLVTAQGSDVQGNPVLEQVFLLPQQEIYPNHHVILPGLELINSQLIGLTSTDGATQEYTSAALTSHVTDNSLEQSSALYQSAVSQPTVTQNLDEKQEQSYLESFKKFGMKVNDIRDQRQKLIENTKDLISGQDVLNINSAVTISNEKSSVETSTLSQYSTVAVTETPQLTTITEASLKQQPIVVAEVSENSISTTPQYEVEDKEALSENVEKSVTGDGSHASSVIVTPRPVSINFLAPITAGIRLENGQHHQQENYKSQVEVMKSIPYYLGKYEYPLEYAQKYGAANSTSVVEKATEDIELGKTLLFFPTLDIPKTAQQLPKVETKQKFSEVNHQHITEVQGYPHNIIVHPERKLYPFRFPVEVPYPVIKQVQVPVKIEKVVEKPVPVTKIVEKPVHIPQPYPVEKIVDRPVHIPIHITKYIDRPYPVEVKVPVPHPYPVDRIIQKIVKQPYPVEVKVPVHIDRIIEKKVPVPQYIEKPVPVEKIIEKPVPHYIDRPYPFEVKVPVPQPVPVEKIVEKPVPQYIDRPYPVEVKVPVTKIVPVEKIVEKPVPQYIDRPYPVKVPVAVAQPVTYQKFVGTQTAHFVDRPYFVPYHGGPYLGATGPIIGDVQKHNHHQFLPTHHLQKFHIVPVITDNGIQVQNQNVDSHAQAAQNSHSFLQSVYVLNPYAYAPQYIPTKKEEFAANGYLPPIGKCDNNQQTSHQTNYADYIGLQPPRPTANSFLGKFRSARSSFNDKSIRLEDGFKPPLVPSLEIDEQGNPIETDEK